MTVMCSLFVMCAGMQEDKITWYRLCLRFDKYIKSSKIRLKNKWFWPKQWSKWQSTPSQYGEGRKKHIFELFQLDHYWTVLQKQWSVSRQLFFGPLKRKMGSFQISNGLHLIFVLALEKNYEIRGLIFIDRDHPYQ